MEKVTPVEAGVEVTSMGASMTVEPSCQGKGGAWYCVTHDQTFRHNLDKDNHIRTGTHVLAWVCPEHGFEAP